MTDLLHSCSKPRVLITGGKGYIGSRLRLCMEEAGRCCVESVDTLRFGTGDGRPSRPVDYRSLEPDDLAPFDTIVHLAAHSSVALCLRDPQGAVENNITGFTDLVKKCGVAATLNGGAVKRLIYASSSSAYNGSGSDTVTEEGWQGFRPTNRYDVSKFTMDLLAQTEPEESGVALYGLRLGTVCGWSPNLRTDLMINRMALDAREKGVITVTNPEAHRPILDMDDLCRAVLRLVIGPKGPDTAGPALLLPPSPPPGIYNLASFNATVSEVAQRVARYCGKDVLVQVKEGTATYDFSMSCKKFEETLRFAFCGSVESIVDGLIAHPPVHTGGRP